MTALLARVVLADTPIAWQEDFDGSGIPKQANFFFQGNGRDVTSDAVVIQSMTNGIFRFGLHYDSKRNQELVNLLFGDMVWWQELMALRA